MSKLTKDYSKREITAPVLVPDECDYDGHIYSAEEVEKAYTNYITQCNRVNIQHAIDVEPSVAEFINHWITPEDSTIEIEAEVHLVKKGTWLATMKVHNDDLWEAVKEGQFTGFSIQALCKSEKLQKFKVVGRTTDDLEVKKRLYDIDFSNKDHHIALVDEAANATKILVVKAREPKTKENEMTVTKEQLEALELEKSKLNVELDQVSKSKVELEVQLEELKKAKASTDSLVIELENLKKEKKQQELIELVTKAKTFKADNAEEFSLVLQKCKDSLGTIEYELLCKQLDKLPNLLSSEEFLKNKGEGASGEDNLEKNKDKKFETVRKELIKGGLSARDASKKARLEVYNQ